MTALTWPPPYSVRISHKAKHLQLRFKRGTGLEVVVPKRYKRPPIDHLLQQHRGWIEKQIAQTICVERVDSLIHQVNLRCFAQTWSVVYGKATLERLNYTVDQEARTVTFSKVPSCTSDIHQPLRHWLRNHAVHLLPQRIAELARIHNFEFAKVTIRRQKTRWGSCSAKGSISLNDKLLFLPAQLADHVMLHELCHTVHMNHSSQFWHLLTQVDPSSVANKKALREADSFIPNWVEN